MDEPGSGQNEVAVIGAGIIGCAVAWALTKAGRRVFLIDRADPATAGASFGNVGHIATEQLQPLPSPRLLLSFWRELTAFGGVLDIPMRRAVEMAPWMTRFAFAAFHQVRNTAYFAPLVRNAADTLESQLREIGRLDLLRRNGHYALWMGAKAAARAAAEQARAAGLGIATRDAPDELIRAAITHDKSPKSAPVAGLWFPDTAHVLDPPSVARAFASASAQAGASVLRALVRHMRPQGNRIEIVTDTGSLLVQTAVVCAGAWSAPLLAPFGIRAPIEAERGYHIELPNHAALIDAPILYADHNIFVTPMASRLRASSYLEFAGLNTPPDPGKPALLRTKLRQFGYQCDEGASWMGPRPTLPDYLPGIGRAQGQQALFYAVGHQHLGLTLSAVTAEVIADLVTGCAPRYDIAAFDLRRFGSI